MTSVGLLCPELSPEDDYLRIELLLNTDIRVPVVRTGGGREWGPPDDLPGLGERLRLAGAESVVWASTRGSFGQGWEAAHEQVRTLAVTTGLPASSTSLAFVRALGAVGAGRIAVAAAYPPDLADPFVRLLGAAGVEVVAARADGEAGSGLVELVRAADHPAAQAVVVPDTALHTVAHLPELEAAVGKPVLTATQVTVWEGLRLAERRGAWSTELGTLFARKDQPEPPAGG
ncbi:decarboxylase [Streptomyces sp. HMX112]|uniref:maleate cis-trans isomerase family protein n=1 Tax=Streptomyces sp. HMX112 TaxID=3390850 RepID=UPI003A7FE929